MSEVKKILCIEDDHFISEMYLRALKNAGFEVTETDTGANAVEMARAGNYDLILLDLWIPEKNGIDVLKELRGEDGSGLPDTKIIITTNYAQDDQSRAALAAKADGYFIKAEMTPRKIVEISKQLIGPAER